MFLPCGEQIQELRSDDSGKNRDESHVPHGVDDDALPSREMNGNEQSDDQARGNKDSICGNKEVSDLKKTGIHESATSY